jgi:flagellar biosynthetic protein FliR
MVPYGQMALGPDISMTIIDLFCQCTVLAVKFALPVIAVEMVVEMGIGIIMKAVPQINVFVVNLQAKLFIGIVILVLLFVPFSNFVERVITLLFDAIQQLISAMA